MLLRIIGNPREVLDKSFDIVLVASHVESSTSLLLAPDTERRNLALFLGLVLQTLACSVGMRFDLLIFND